jgi:hypothetical protein
LGLIDKWGEARLGQIERLSVLQFDDLGLQNGVEAAEAIVEIVGDQVGLVRRDIEAGEAARAEEIPR